MLERDYVMHLVRQFGETLEKLKEKRETDAFAMKKEIQQLYLTYLGHSIKTSVADKRKMWSKSLSFFEYIDSHSDTFSFDRRGKIAKIRELLKQ